MGRKIPGRKHHGVRDPEKQRQQREAQLKDKINAPPTDPEEQAVSKTLSKIIELKEKVKSGEISLKRKRKHKKPKQVTSHPFGVKPIRDGEKTLPVYTQGKHEPDRQFLHRVQKITHSVLREVEFENKFGVDVKRNPHTGEVERLEKRKRDVLVKFVKEAKKEQKLKGKKKKKKKENDEEKLTKSQKKSLKLKEKKEKKKRSDLDFDDFKDDVMFGEIVDAPPSLTAPRKITRDEAPRPGKKDLLLKSLMNPDKGNSDDVERNKDETVDKRTKTLNKVIDRRGKRKDLPGAVRRQLEKQQRDVIEAYKLLKSKKHENK